MNKVRSLDYRREIDGLRALAVIPVILFHAGFEMFGGGFVGVDVFFVISGYLISTIIFSELESGKFSLINFYERRARRILPALFFVMFFCIPFAWFWLLPSDMKDFSQSLIVVSVFASNILFWRESGYFEIAAELKPLIHTWSLAVEEQYYVLFPIFLMIFWRIEKAKLLILLIVLFFISFIIAQWGAHVKPVAAFYLLPSRGWEFLTGAFAAFYLSTTNHTHFSKVLSEIGGWLGLTLVLFAVFTYTKATPFPGFYALVPTVGTLLIILFATQQTIIGKFLGNKTFVGVGLISYSAYLWHQPLFAFARQRSLNEPSQNLYIVLVVTAFILAYFSWRYVEAPFRRKEHITRKKVFLSAFIFSGFFCVVGLIGHFTDGVFLNRENAVETVGIDTRMLVNHGLSSDCTGGFNESPNCMTHNNPEILVWGDSFAMHLVQGFLASNPDVRLVQKTVSICGPILDIAPMISKYTRSWSEKCILTNNKVFEYLKDNPNIKYVVISSPFDQYVQTDATVLTSEGEIVLGQTVSFDAMVSTINRIKLLGKIPVVFSPTPQNGENIGRCLMKAKFFNEDITLCNVMLADSLARKLYVWDFLKKVEKIATVVWLTEGLCSSDICNTSINDVFIYRDHGHLSHEGSAYLGQKMNFYALLEKAASIEKY